MVLFVSARGAGGAGAPEGHFGLIDGVTSSIRRSETRSGADGAVDIDDSPAATAHEVMMVVAHARLVSGRRSRRLDTPQDARVHECRQCVVHRLLRDGADLVTRGVGDGIGRGMGMVLHRGQDRQALCRHLEPVLLEDVSSGGHGS